MLIFVKDTAYMVQIRIGDGAPRWTPIASEKAVFVSAPGDVARVADSRRFFGTTMCPCIIATVDVAVAVGRHERPRVPRASIVVEKGQTFEMARGCRRAARTLVPCGRTDQCHHRRWWRQGRVKREHLEHCQMTASRGRTKGTRQRALAFGDCVLDTGNVAYGGSAIDHTVVFGRRSRSYTQRVAQCGIIVCNCRVTPCDKTDAYDSIKAGYVSKDVGHHLVGQDSQRVARPVRGGVLVVGRIVAPTLLSILVSHLAICFDRM